MILTKHFVALHLPKTGSSFSTQLLRAHAPSEWELSVTEGHPTWRDIPESHRALPVLGTIRSPWTFYVSWYAFALRHWMHWEFVRRITVDGTASFKETLQNLYASPEVQRSDFGGYGHLIYHIYGDRASDVLWMRTENLRHDMLEKLAQVVEVPDGLRAALLETPPINRGAHDDPSSYYDDELVALVEEKDRPVFEFFGYEMGLGT